MRRAGGEALRLVASGLALAATPVFAGMAVLAAVDPAAAVMCGGGSPLSGMATMYALMALFHAGAWLRLLRRPPQA
jgi:MFS superfamily sulfate permease-like transporter